MNCKPGDLAIIKSVNPRYNGRIVEVLCAVTSERFNLPDGYPAVQVLTGEDWVLKFIGGPTMARTISGTRQTWYGVGADRYLRRLPGDEDMDVEEERLPETVRSAP